MKSSLLILAATFTTAAYAGVDSTVVPVDTLTQGENFSAALDNGEWTKQYSGSTLGSVRIPNTAKWLYATFSNGQSALVPTMASPHTVAGEVHDWKCRGTRVVGGVYSNFTISGKQLRENFYCKLPTGYTSHSLNVQVRLTSVYYM